MKNLILMFAFIAFIGMASAQDKTITADQVFTVKGGAADTIRGASGENTYTMFISNFCTAFKVGVKQTKTSGTASEGHYTVSGSLDNGNWTSIASLNIHGSTVTSARYVETSTLTPYYPYIKVYAAGGDSTGTQKIQYYILVKKN